MKCFVEKTQKGGILYRIIHLKEENNTLVMDNLDSDVLPGLSYAEKSQARARCSACTVSLMQVCIFLTRDDFTWHKGQHF